MVDGTAAVGLTGQDALGKSCSHSPHCLSLLSSRKYYITKCWKYLFVYSSTDGIIGCWDEYERVKHVKPQCLQYGVGRKANAVPTLTKAETSHSLYPSTGKPKI